MENDAIIILMNRKEVAGIDAQNNREEEIQNEWMSYKMNGSGKP